MKRAVSLEAVANISIIVSAVVFCVVMLRVARVPADAHDATRPYLPGERIEAIKGIEPSTAKPTLLLVVRSTCPFCTQSMPFYRQLLDRASALHVRAVALVFDRQEVGEAYLETNGLSPHQTIALDGNQLVRVKATPTLILIDASGKVINSWVGKLGSQAESEVIEALRRAS